MALTPKQEAFINEYFQCWNATQAAIRAGYSEKTARSIGAENLTKPDIQDAIRARMSEVAMSANEVLSRLTEIARGDMGDFIDDNSLSVNIKAAQAKGKMPLVKKVKYVTRVEDDSQTDTVEFELYDKLKAIELLGKIHGMFVNNIDVTSGGEKLNPIIFIPEVNDYDDS